MKYPVVVLKSGKDRPLVRHHPWIFSGAIQHIKGNVESGETVEVQSAEGKFLAWGSYSPESQIRVRVLSWNKQEEINEEFFENKILESIKRREVLGLTIGNKKGTNAFRIVHGESDGLPGFIADAYNRTISIQLLTAGAEYWKESIVNIMSGLKDVENVYERSDVDVRRMEGLEEHAGLLSGNEVNEEEINENGLNYFVDIEKGQKTGFYLDQRDNRFAVRSFAKDKDVLNCFCYTGGFTLNALEGGAKRVLSIDSSEEAIEIAKRNVELNKLESQKCEWLTEDVFQALRRFRDEGKTFDMIILDPPKFASHPKHVEGALRGYKDINMLAFKLLRANGLLFTYSCSGSVTREMFQTSVAWAAMDAGSNGRVIKYLSQAGDHPISLSFPEGEYLKGLIVQKE
jgi:23S rRNA (cytosine1962-C5)-methyltransferase